MNRVVVKSALLITAVIVLATVAVDAQIIGFPSRDRGNTRDPLMVDYAWFRGQQPDMVRLELYYQVMNRGLDFELKDSTYRASYNLDVKVSQDDVVVQKDSREREVVLREEEQVRTRTDYRTGQVNFEIPPGKYKVMFTLHDLNSHRVTTKDLDVHVDDTRQKTPSLSMIEFSQAFEAGNTDTTVFDKGNMVVVPSVSRAYGGEATDRVAFYFEVYPGEDSVGKVVIDTRIRHNRKGLMYRDTLHVWLGSNTERQLREVSLGDIAPGDYELEIALRGRRMKEVDKRTEEFRVVWTEEGMIRHDWKNTVMQLDLLTEDDNLNDMKKIESYEDRLKAFNEFWLSHDPTPGTPENEVKLAFYGRVQIANENFGVMRRPGWKTDRGQIYIQFGAPDHLVDVPFAPESRPYQIWHYTNIGRYRRFLFIDENADGDYRLQYPYDGLNQRPDF